MVDESRSHIDVIRSPESRSLTHVKSLRQRDAREAERLFVVEGFRAVGDAIDAGAQPRVTLLREDIDPAHPVAEAARQHGPVRRVAAKMFDGLVDTQTPQGILAIFPFPDLVPEPKRAPLLLLVDQVRDPGNLGTLLRASAGAGVTQVILTPGCVDPFNPKVVRAAMGAHFRVPIRWYDDQFGNWLETAVPLRVETDATSTLPYDALDLTQPCLLLLGSEAEGVTPEVASLATTAASIPLANGVESLNAAVAGSIFLFEAARQRRRGPARSRKS